MIDDGHNSHPNYSIRVHTILTLFIYMKIDKEKKKKSQIRATFKCLLSGMKLNGHMLLRSNLMLRSQAQKTVGLNSVFPIFLEFQNKLFNKSEEFLRKGRLTFFF